MLKENCLIQIPQLSSRFLEIEASPCFSNCPLFGVIILLEEVKALELYSIVYSECRHHTGLILDVEEAHLLLLDTKGEFRKLPRRRLKRSWSTTPSRTPFELIWAPACGASRKVTSRESRFSFHRLADPVSWGLIVFMTSGQIPPGQWNSQTLRIRMVEPEKSPQSQFLCFRLRQQLPRCKSLDESEPGRVQRRMVTVSASRNSSRFIEGFDQLDRFESRTGYYARPYLYDTQTKLAGNPEWPIPGKSPGPSSQFSMVHRTEFWSPGQTHIGTEWCLHHSNMEPFSQFSFPASIIFFPFNTQIFPHSLTVRIFWSTTGVSTLPFSNTTRSNLVFRFNQNTMTGSPEYSLAEDFSTPWWRSETNFQEILSEKFSPIGVFKYRPMKPGPRPFSPWSTWNPRTPEDIRLILAEEMWTRSTLPSIFNLIDQIESFDLDSSFLRIIIQSTKRRSDFGMSEFYFRSLSGTSSGDYRLNFQHLVTSVKMDQVFGDMLPWKHVLIISSGNTVQKQWLFSLGR